MSKNANAGELRTMVFFKKIVRETDSEGYPSESAVNVFGADACVYCKWVNAHGSESWTAMQLELRQPATITVRYSPLIDDETLLVYKMGDKRPYEIISINNVENRDVWLEIKVQRKVEAR